MGDLPGELLNHDLIFAVHSLSGVQTLLPWDIALVSWPRASYTQVKGSRRPAPQFKMEIKGHWIRFFSI